MVSLSILRKSLPAATSRTWNPSGRPAGDHGHAVEDDGTRPGADRSQGRFAEPGLAGVPPEQEVERDRLDGLFREYNHLFTLPVVRPARKPAAWPQSCVPSR